MKWWVGVEGEGEQQASEIGQLVKVMLTDGPRRASDDEFLSRIIELN